MSLSRLLISPLALALFTLSAPASADSLASAANDLCEKVKACTLAEMNQQELTPELKAMMEPMLENMCAAMREGIREVPVDHKLHDPAVACLRSMAQLSCADFQDDTKVDTPACQQYRQMAEKAYGGN